MLIIQLTDTKLGEILALSYNSTVKISTIECYHIDETPKHFTKLKELDTGEQFLNITVTLNIQKRPTFEICKAD